MAQGHSYLAVLQLSRAGAGAEGRTIPLPDSIVQPGDPLPRTMCWGVRSVGVLNTELCSMLGQLSYWLLEESGIAFGSGYYSFTPRGIDMNWLLLE